MRFLSASTREFSLLVREAQYPLEGIDCRSAVGSLQQTKHTPYLYADDDRRKQCSVCLFRGLKSVFAELRQVRGTTIHLHDVLKPEETRLLKSNMVRHMAQY